MSAPADSTYRFVMTITEDGASYFREGVDEVASPLVPASPWPD